MIIINHKDNYYYNILIMIYIIGEYLELSRTSLPTPPSSPENTGDTGFPLSRVVTTYSDQCPRGQSEVTYRALPPVPVQRENSEPGYHHTKYQDPSTLAREIG